MKTLTLLFISSVILFLVPSFGVKKIDNNLSSNPVLAKSHKNIIYELDLYLVNEARLKKGQIKIMDIPEKGVAVVDNNNTPDYFSDDKIKYTMVGNQKGYDQISYMIVRKNKIIYTASLCIDIACE